MSNAPGEAASSGEQVPPHVSGARMDADMASLFAEGGLELGPLPSSLLMVAQTTGGATEFCIQTVPHEARDARVRACFDAAEGSLQALLRELRARVARSRLCALLDAHCVEDFNVMNVGTHAERDMHVFRRVAFKSPSALPRRRRVGSAVARARGEGVAERGVLCGDLRPPRPRRPSSAPPLCARLTRPNCPPPDFLPSDANAVNDLRDTGSFKIDGWKLLPALEPCLGPDALNGSAPVQALLLQHIFQGALPRGRVLSLWTLLYDDCNALMPPELLRDAFYDFRTPTSTAVLRNAVYATRVGVDGASLTAAQVAGLAPSAREALERARSAQLLHALTRCVELRWSGGVLFLRRFFDDSRCCSELRSSLDALCQALHATRDDSDAAPPAAPQAAPPPPMPPLPESTCGACHETMGASRHLCGRCRDVLYHDARCQAAHWPEHKRGATDAPCGSTGTACDSALTAAPSLLVVCRPAQPAQIYAAVPVYTTPHSS